MFHYAWLIKAIQTNGDPQEYFKEPDPQSKLRAALEKWKADFTHQQEANAKIPLPPGVTPTSNNPDDYLPKIVREVLKN